MFVGSGDNVGIKTDSPEEKLDVNGDIRTSSLVVGNSTVNENSIKTEILEANEIIVQETGEVIQGIPAGIIFFWSGPITNIPVGWALCDGTNNTPDLSDLFILGTDNFHNPGDRGGTIF